MLEAVIFDMDGLMVDTEPLQSKSFEIVLREYGVVPKRNSQGIVQTVGVNALDNWRKLKEEYGINVDVEELVLRKRMVYSSLLLTEPIDPLPGLDRLISVLELNQTKRAIASSSSTKHIMCVIKKLGIAQSFDTVVSGEDVARGKPHPDIFLKTAERLHVSPRNCVVLEDSENGVRGAKAAGMKVVAVPSKFTKNHNFVDSNLVVETLEFVDFPTLLSL